MLCCQAQRCLSLAALPSASSTGSCVGHLLTFRSCFHYHYFTEQSLHQELASPVHLSWENTTREVKSYSASD